MPKESRDAELAEAIAGSWVCETRLTRQHHGFGVTADRIPGLLK
jgi:hypothetical protein